MPLIAKSNLLQSLSGLFSSLGLGYTGNRQCKLNIGQHCLVRYQIIALKHKTDGMISIRIPISVTVFLC